MDLANKLRGIMEQEFGITTDEQLNEAFEKMDMSDFGIFVRKGNKNEVKKDGSADLAILLNAV